MMWESIIFFYIFIFRCLLIIAVNCEIHRFDYLCQTRSMTKTHNQWEGKLIFQFSRHLTWYEMGNRGTELCVNLVKGNRNWIFFYMKWCGVDWFEWCWLVIRGHFDWDDWSWPRGLFFIVKLLIFLSSC